MNLDNWLVLIILLVSVVLFVSEKLRVDLVALLVLVSLVVSRLLTPDEAFTGFASPAVVTVWAVFIVSGGLTRSGIADMLARRMVKLAGNSEIRLMLAIMLMVGFMSAFMNNIGAVAILLPAVMGMARTTRIPPSKLLLPMAFASLLGGNLTLIGTPPNILATSILENRGLPPFGFFDFTPLGLVVLAAGIVYMLLFGRHLLPSNSHTQDLSKAYRLRGYISELRVLRNSPLVGKSVVETDFGGGHALHLLVVERGTEKELLAAVPDRVLQAGDLLIVEGDPQSILATSEEQGLELVPARKFAQLEQKTSGSFEIVEITLAPNSEFGARTLRQIHFRNRYGSTVMAIRRAGEAQVSRIADVPLNFGDALLVQGPQKKINLLRQDANFLVLDTPRPELRRTRKAPLAVGILLGVLVVVATGWLHVSTAMLIGALLMVLSGTLTMDEAYQSIHWQSVFLIAGMLPLGLAMEQTGTAALLAGQINALLSGWGPLAVLVGMFALTALLTEVMSNAASTVLIVPIALDVAHGLGADPRAFVIAVVLAASTSFLMPIGHQVNVIVFGPGGYKFSDYAKVGVWLNLIILLIVAFILPLIWPLFP